MKTKILLVALFAGAIVAFFALDLGQHLTLDGFRAQQDTIETFHRENTALTVGIYFVTYVLVTALSLPGATIMTLVGGAIFGLLWGTVIVSFASTIGATLAFLLGRFLFRDAVQRRFGKALKSVNEGVERDGPLYLFMLRLVPAFPFFVINLVMALTPMKVLTFFVVSQVGMLPGTLVYVNAGTQIAQLQSAGDILSLQLIGAFALLGIFPFIARWVAGLVQRRKAFKGWVKPRHFDRNLVVIGAGSAGLVTAYIAAAVKAKVSLVEKHEMGGDCLNTGCVPSKALIRSAKFVSQVNRHEEFGIGEASSSHCFPEIMDRVQRVIATIEPHDSVERYEGLGVDVIQGEARITGPWSVAVNGRTLTTR
ncbi:MAG: VTT domain-containing protein, partial [Phycisphaeraceae bacterium]